MVTWACGVIVTRLPLQILAAQFMVLAAVRPRGRLQPIAWLLSGMCWRWFHCIGSGIEQTASPNLGCILTKSEYRANRLCRSTARTENHSGSPHASSLHPRRSAQTRKTGARRHDRAQNVSRMSAFSELVRAR